MSGTSSFTIPGYAHTYGSTYGFENFATGSATTTIVPPETVNRTAERGMELVQVINENTPAKAELFRWQSKYQVQPDVDVVINATSIGLYPHVHDRLDLDIGSLRLGMVVADVIPNPPRTHLIKDAEARGCTIVDGLGMLVNQGVIGIKYWTGVDADAAVMRRKLEEIYREE